MGAKLARVPARVRATLTTAALALVASLGDAYLEGLRRQRQTGEDVRR